MVGIDIYTEHDAHVNPAHSIDLNECEMSVCSENADCTNIVGSYMCQCQLGYSGDGLMCSSEFI